MTAPTDEPARICTDCGRSFVIEAAEVAFLEDLARKNYWSALHLPKRCVACRSERRCAQETVTADGEDLTVRCVECGADFEFRSRDRQFYAARGFRFPRRCPACRARG
jgi:hypothetical protein